MAGRTVSWFALKYAPTTPCRWPAKVVGSNPSSGSKLHTRAVRSLDAVSRKRESLDHSIVWILSKCAARSRCRTNGANSISPLVSVPGVEGVCQICRRLPTPTAKCRPDGENLREVTRPLKEKWWMAMRRWKLVRIARPVSSTVSRRFPRGDRSRRSMFVRCEKGRVYEVFLQEI